MGKHLFSSSSHHTTVDVRSLSQPRTWPSFTPLSSSGLLAGNVLLRHCFQEDTWGVAAHCWLSEILPLGTVVLLEKSSNYWVSLGPVGHIAVVAWPITAASHAGQTLFSLATGPEPIARCPWVVVLSEEAYKVVPVKALSPASSFLASGKQFGDHIGVTFQQCGPAVSMLHNAARNCFWAWTKAQLEKLMAYRMIPAVKPWDVFQACLLLIENILGPQSPEQLDDIFACRANPRSEVTPQGVDLEEELGDALDGQDEQEAQDHIKQETQQKDACKPWKESWSAWRTQKLPHDNPSSSSSSTGRSKRKSITKLPNNLDLDQWKLCMPPKGFLYESFTDGRVRSYYLGGGGRPSTSASIELYGKRGALVHCVQFCWKLHMDAFPGSECHVAGLMGESVQPL